MGLLRTVLVAFSVLLVSPATAEQTPDQHVERGDYAYNKGDYRKAIDQYRAAIDAGDKRFETSLRLARGLSHAGDGDAAIEVLKKLLGFAYNPREEVLNGDAFLAVRQSENYESLRTLMLPCRDGAYAEFAFIVGRWEVGNDGNAENEQDQSSAEFVADGCAIHEKYWSVYGYEAQSFLAYDKHRNLWTMLNVDNQGWYLNFTEVESESGIVLEARDTNARYRMTKTIIDENKYRLVWLRSRDDGATWDTFVDSTYRRIDDDS